MFKLLTVICLIIATGISVESQFSGLDIFLLDDLEATESRVRRDAGHDGNATRKLYRNLYCCEGEMKFDPKLWEEMRAAQKECMEETRANENHDASFNPFDCEMMEKFKQEMVCMNECFGRKLAIVNGNNELDRESIVGQWKNRMADNKWQVEIAEEIIDKCIAKIKEEMAEVKPGECSEAPLRMKHCIWTSFSRACPASLQINSPRCLHIREFFAESTDPSAPLTMGFFHSLRHSFWPSKH